MVDRPRLADIFMDKRLIGFGFLLKNYLLSSG